MVVTSDFHGHPPLVVPACDLLLIPGDIHGVTAEWLLSVPAASIVGVAGNHDYDVQDDPGAVQRLPWVYLQDTGATVAGFKVWGTPWSVQFGSWAFMRRDEALAAIWRLIPDDTEILVVHGPARGYGDLAQGRNSVGSRTLAERIDQLQDLKLVAFGHIHEGYGVTRTFRCVSCGRSVGPWSQCPAPCDTDLKDSNNRTAGPVFVNASYMDEWYRPGNPPVVIDL